jgi:hypothetical protein
MKQEWRVKEKPSTPELMASDDDMDLLDDDESPLIKAVSRMLIDSGVVINLMSYSVFKKLEREDDELMKKSYQEIFRGKYRSQKIHGRERVVSGETWPREYMKPAISRS